MQKHTITSNEAGQRFDKFLGKYFSGAGTSLLYKMLRKKNITLNGKKATGKEITVVGDSVESFFSEDTYRKFTVAETTFSKSDAALQLYYDAFHSFSASIVYEDSDLLIVNKPAGILSQQDGKTKHSINEWCIGYLLETGALTKEELHTFHPSVLNRLDRNTTGAISVGKSLRGSQYYSKLLHDRSMGKYYLALCHGQYVGPSEAEGYLHKNPHTNTVTITKSKISEKDAYISTGFRVIKSNEQYSLLEIALHTGKSHQIRAHMASLGHPLIGDCKYGAPKNHFGVDYQLLHAARLEMEDKTIHVPVSPLFQRIEDTIFPE